jgi:16S rRNA (guanine527-N7)-methyltransferase
MEGCLDRLPEPLPTRVDSLPTLPPAYADAEEAVLSALRIEVPARARARIGDHVRLLLAWNDAINLTAIRDPAAIAIRHVADSLLGLAPLREASVERFVDIGSGGGFPGVPLAAALPAAEVLLVESVGKKARFLEAAARAVGEVARIQVAAARAESVGHDRAHRGRWQGVVARAVAPLEELVELGLPLLEPDGILLAWKSGDPGDPAGLGGEIAAARRDLGEGSIAVGASVAETLAESADESVSAIRSTLIEAIGDHRLVTIRRGRKPLPEAWPRDPAVRRRGRR